MQGNANSELLAPKQIPWNKGKLTGAKPPPRGTHSLGHRFPPEHEARAAPTGRAIMREPQEVERLQLAETPSTPIRDCGSDELDKSRLVGIKGESEACEPCLEIGKELLCLVLMLEANDRVIRIAHDNNAAGSTSLPPLVGP